MLQNVFVRNLRIFEINKSVFPGKLFQPSLMFAGKARKRCQGQTL
jgi:hypothetical protein